MLQRRCEVAEKLDGTARSRPGLFWDGEQAARMRERLKALRKEKLPKRLLPPCRLPCRVLGVRGRLLRAVSGAVDLRDEEYKHWRDLKQVKSC